MPLLVHGIPSCGTVKKARAWLDRHGIAYTFVDLREAPPSATTVATWVKHFGDKALRNTSGGSYRALGPEKDAWTAAQWTRAFAGDPMLIKRPVVTRDAVPLIVGWNLDDAEILARLNAPGAR